MTPLPGSETDRAAFTAALHELEAELDAMAGRAARMRERIGELVAQLAADRPLREIVPAERAPLLVQLLSEQIAALQATGHRLRSSEARTLHAEGLTMDAIAELFGVTRQRVSALLRDP